MTKRVTLVHTVRGLVPVFRDLTNELVPGVATTDVVDEGLLEETVAAGRIPEATARRLESLVGAAVDHGSDVVLVTCSSVGPAVDEIRERTGWPVVRVDEAMADAALALGSAIGVIATLSSTLEPTAELIRRRAGDRQVVVITRLCEGAFAALKAGDLNRHDDAVREGLRDLLPLVDVIVLAQASMARVATTLGGDAGDTPILASPRLGVERLAELVGGGGHTP
ncbi:MAG TPA: aspartate/glutamate racemase family protein [Candidatus Limnocylindrales bacterium]